MSVSKRDEVREMIKSKGITCENITLGSVKRLRKILSRHLCQSEIFDGSAKLTRLNKIYKDIKMKTNVRDTIACISFDDKFNRIEIAEWARDENLQPIISALVEWIEGEELKNG